MQHIIDLQEWTFDEFAYLDTVLANVTDVEVILTNDNKISTYDTLEKKARYLEIHGESLNNRTKDSNKTYDLIDYATIPMTNGAVTPNDNLKVDMLIQNIEGNTYASISNSRLFGLTASADTLEKAPPGESCTLDPKVSITFSEDFKTLYFGDVTYSAFPNEKIPFYF